MKTDLDDIFVRHGTGRQELIPLLQEVQDRHGYLSRDAIVAVGSRLGVAPAKVYGVATFYNQFRFHPPGRYHIQVCRGTACHVKGSKKLLDRIQRDLDVAPGETTRDGMFSLEVVACMGACGLAPAMSVSGRMHAKVAPEDVAGILDDYRKRTDNDEDAAGS